MSASNHKPAPSQRVLRHLGGPLGIAVAATVATLATLGPAAGGPGVTCDEFYHVDYGKRLVTAVRQQGPAFLAPANIRRNFPWKPGGAPVHPPLGNWILGWTHHLFDPAPDNPFVISIAAARFAPALALGLLVLLVGLCTARAEGFLAGNAAALAVVLVPRVFGHAHLAALDTLTALFFVAAVLAVIEADRRGGRLWHFGLAGIVSGLAMLVRLHGLLLLVPVAAWLIWRLRRRAAAPLAAWTTAAAATLFLGWPWLWLAPLENLRQYLGTATGRVPLHVFYAQAVWADCDVPWHYPTVMFVVALPLGLLVFGLLGLWARRRSWKAEPGFPLVIGTLAFLLLVFSWPGVPVYDGVRLFLPVFALWAVAVGSGAGWVADHHYVRRLAPRLRGLLVGLLLGSQGAGLILYHPWQLSHYSLLVGGLGGAQRLGFEVTYWGDSVTEPLLAEAARRATDGAVLFGPNLAPFQATAVETSSPALQDARVRLVDRPPSGPEEIGECRYAVFYHRRADLGEVQRLMQAGRVVEEHSRQGVWLARLVEFPTPLQRPGH